MADDGENREMKEISSRCKRQGVLHVFK